MRRTSIFDLLILNLLIPLGLSAAPVLIEGYNEQLVVIPEGETDTATIVELLFSVDTSCYVQFTAGGVASQAKEFLRLDGADLFPTAIVRGDATYSTHIAYAYLLTSGNHSIELRMTPITSFRMTTCHNAYLQALIFLPDEPDAVAEQPPGDNPQPRAHSVVSQGPWVSAPGATELYDLNGRKVSTVPQDGRISLQELPTGTYFAQAGSRTILKIVKVD